MTDRPTPVVLVHGAWHGGWCWDPFLPYLTARGLAPHAPDLPGHGKNPSPMKDITLDSYAECVVDVLDSLDEPAILVGHSMGGPTISEAAERRPDKVKYLVYVAALMVPDGVPVAQRMKEDTAAESGKYVQRGEDGLSLIMPEDGLRAATYQGMNEDQIQWALGQLVSEAIAPMTTPVHLTADNFGRVPRSYVECTEDKAISIAMQRRMQEDLPCDPVLTLDCGHMAPWVEPDRVADFIASLK